VNKSAKVVLGRVLINAQIAAPPLWAVQKRHLRQVDSGTLYKP